MRKLNTKRMQRYVYRNTPDRVELHVDALKYDNDHIKAIMDGMLADFMTKMTIKHQGKNMMVDVFQDDWLMHDPTDVVFVFQARPREGKMTIVNTPSPPGRSLREPS